MRIQLTVIEYEENPNYKPAPTGDMYGRNFDARPDEERWDLKQTRRLDVQLTEDEWKAVKKAVVEVM